MDGTTARKIYPSAPAELRMILEESFGKNYFSQNITDRVKTIDDAYEAIGEVRPTDNALLELGLTPDEVCYRHLKVLAKALNEGWAPNMYDTGKKKYYPYFSVGSSSFAFNVALYDCSAACAGDASHLCFKSSELARYAGEQFAYLYEAFITK